METCGTCKNWKRIDQEEWYERESNDTRYGTCQAIPHAAIKWDQDSDRNLIAGDWKAVAVDGSGFFAAIKTQECFGCVLHKPIPQE
jgi:hypothetical protein